jgi:hypothetical protein
MVDKDQADIIEAANGYRVNFFANSPKGNQRMLERYGTTDILFALPAQSSEALAFRKWAEDAGLALHKFGIED